MSGMARFGPRVAEQTTLSNYRDYDEYGNRRENQRSTGLSPVKLRLLLALAIVAFSLLAHFSNTSENPITGENQRVAGLTTEMEVQMGLQAAPEMARQFGGLSDNLEWTQRVKEMGARLMNALYHRLQREGKSIPWSFEFHLLADNQTVNAFALPGGQVFITEAIYREFTHPGQLAGVLGHEIGHVLERHGAQRMAQQRLWQGLGSAAGVAGGDVNSARAAQAVLGFVSMKYGREDELESDRWGVELMVLTGYHPDRMLEVMDILEKSTGGAGPPEFMSTHPRPARRREYINSIIAELFPNGIPDGLR